MGKKMVQCQDAYYKQTGSRKTGVRWAGKVIVHMWGMIHKMWIGHNDVLHKKEIINSLSGACLLDIKIERIYDAGCAHLPEVVHKWFQQPKEQLLAQSIEYKKGWVLIVQTVEESLNVAEYSILSSPRALRRWVGLRQH
jgi:hypothetical protein